MENVNSDLIRGSIDTIILRCLHRGEMYGLEICNLIREASDGTYILKQPTLYSALKRLEQRKMISSFWQDSAIGGRRHYYKLTDLGMKSFKDKKENWHGTKDVIDTLVDGIKKKQADGEFIKTPDVAVNLHAGSLKTGDMIAAQTVSALDNIFMPPYNPFAESDDYLTLPVGITEKKSNQVQSQVKLERENFEVPQLSKYVLNIEPEARVEMQPVTVSKIDEKAAENKAGKSKKLEETLEKYISPADIRVVRANIESTASLRAAKISQYDVELLPFVKHFQASAPLQNTADKRSEKKNRAEIIKQTAKKCKGIVLINKLRLATAVIVTAVMAASILVLQENLKADYTDDEKVFFTGAYFLIGIYLISYVLLYILKPNLERTSRGFAREHLFRFCVSAALIAAVLCINVLAGLTFINSTDYAVYCVIPCLLSLIVYFEGLVNLLFHKNELFSVWV